MRDEGICSPMVRGTQWWGGRWGMEIGGQDQKVLKEIERYKAREISLCQKLAVMILLFHLLSLFTSSSPSFCSLSDQLLLIKILTADLLGSPSSSPPRPPSLSLSPCFAPLPCRSLSSSSFEDVLLLTVATNNLNTLCSPWHLIFSATSRLYSSSLFPSPSSKVLYLLPRGISLSSHPLPLFIIGFLELCQEI